MTTQQLFNNDGKALMMVLVGKSFKGKSYFLRYLLTERLSTGKLKYGIVFTKTKYNKDYNFLPDNCIFEGYNQKILEKYIDNLKKILASDEQVQPNFIIFDDLVGVLSNQSDFFVNFITTARHLNISIFIAVQYLTGKKAISPVMREQTTHCLMFNSRTRNTLENLYMSYGQLFDNFEQFKNYFMTVTKEKHVGMLYLEAIDELESNYIPIQAPADFPKLKFDY